MNVSFNRIFFLADNHKDFGVNFKVYKSVDYRNAGLFQFCCPGNVALFIKAGFQFDEGYNLFSILSGTFKGCNNRRISSGSVERHFYRQNLRIISGIRDKFYYWIVAFVWNMQNFITNFKGIPERFVIR